ncbi:MAG: tRNA-dihydrouridine synthase, partial [Salibacteraceae bacterium]|nr:tRNA-dihydrouridine synthase [Salibacteraceae bacterium]
KDAGAGILRDIPKMIRLTKAVIESTHLPVTVKTRLGWDDNTKYIVDVAERLQDIGVQAISIHGRTRVQMYKGEADWSLIGEVKNNQRMHIPVFGNGDINTPQKALEMRERYGVDGVMIGRAAIGYPWVFNEIKHFMKTGQIKDLPTIEERAALAKEHLERAIKWKGEKLGVVETRRHYTNYFKGIPHFKETRTRLVTIDDPQELFAILDGVKNEFAGVEIGL